MLKGLNGIAEKSYQKPGMVLPPRPAHLQLNSVVVFPKAHEVSGAVQVAIPQDGAEGIAGKYIINPVMVGNSSYLLHKPLLDGRRAVVPVSGSNLQVPVPAILHPVQRDVQERNL